MSEQVDLETLIRELEKRLESNQSGMMFIKPDDGHSIVVVFKGSVVSAVYSSSVVGKDALYKLAKVGRASYSFGAGSAILPGSETNPDDVSQILGIHRTGAVPSSSAATIPSAASGTGFHDRALALVRERLIDILGPFSTAVLEEALASLPPGELRVPADLQDLIKILASEIDDPKEAEQFKRQTLADLINL